MAKDERDQLLGMLSRFEVAMLITAATDGELRGRPVMVAGIERDGELLFCGSFDEAETHELENDPRCAILVQGKTRWASITGRARVEDDRARVDRLWREYWRLWLPEGKEDPDLRLLRVRPNEAAYWHHSGVRNVRFAPKVEAAEPSVPRPEVGAGHSEAHGKAEL